MIYPGEREIRLDERVAVVDAIVQRIKGLRYDTDGFTADAIRQVLNDCVQAALESRPKEKR